MSQRKCSPTFKREVRIVQNAEAIQVFLLDLALLYGFFYNLSPEWISTKSFLMLHFQSHKMLRMDDAWKHEMYSFWSNYHVKCSWITHFPIPQLIMDDEICIYPLYMIFYLKLILVTVWSWRISAVWCGIFWEKVPKMSSC